MSIAAIGGVSGLANMVSGVTGTGYLAGSAATAATAASSAAAAAAAPTRTDSVNFGTAMSSSIDSLQGLQTTSSNLAVKAVTGDLTDVHDYTIAASEAKTALQLTAAVRNKAIEAFSEIMRMQA